MNIQPKRHQHGVALVEFALVLPLLLVMMCVTTEFGRAYYEYDTLTKSVREAARYLSVRAPSTDVDKAKNIIVYGNPDGRGDPVVPGLSTANVPAPTWSTTGSYPALNTVTVSVTGYTYVPMVGSMFALPLNNIVFGTIQATMRSPS